MEEVDMTAQRNDGENTLFIRDNMGEYYGVPVKDLSQYRLSGEEVESLEATLAKPTDDVSGYMPIYMEYEGLVTPPIGQGQPNWVAISSFQWGVGRGIS
jgi:hypothetical protein